jgi:SAM-dependent methyltransferase
VVAIEPGLDGARNARRRGLEHVICATTHECRLLARSLPAIGVFDVVEHMPDDGAFLRHLQALLVPGGRLFVTVPAYDTLWSHDDVAAGHHRRYTRASVCAALRSAGFEIEYASHFFRVLPLPIFLLRSVPFRLGVRRRAASPAGVTRDHAARRPMLAALLERVLASELAHVAEGRPMTFGASILVIARAVV